jgi:hypothetical protein
MYKASGTGLRIHWAVHDHPPRRSVGPNVLNLTLPVSGRLTYGIQTPTEDLHLVFVQKGLKFLLVLGLPWACVPDNFLDPFRHPFANL